MTLIMLPLVRVCGTTFTRTLEQLIKARLINTFLTCRPGRFMRLSTFYATRHPPNTIRLEKALDNSAMH